MDVKIDSLKVNNQFAADTIKQGESIQLEANDDLYLFLSKSDQEFDLLLKNVQDTYPTSIRSARLFAYSNIPSGTYELLAIQKDSLPRSTLLLHINVQEEATSTNSVMNNWWFIPLLVFYLLLLFGGARYLTLLSGVRNKEKLIELRNEWTNRLHHDIGGDLSSVSLRLDNLKKRLERMDPNVKESVGKTYDILKMIQKKLRYVFDLVDPKKDSLHVALEEIQDFAQENLSLQNIELTYRNDLDTSQNYGIDIGRVNKLQLAMKEVVNNCMKYSKATEAWILIQEANKGLAIEIEDNGVGFDPNEIEESTGLRNLTTDGFIDIHYTAAPSKGTKVHMKVPYL